MKDIKIYFDILGLTEGASPAEVKEAYRDLVKVWHPDRFAHDPKLQEKAQEKLKEINDAYQRIVDHLKNSNRQQQSQQYQGTEKQEKTAGNPPPKHPDKSWICPECLRTNYFSNLHCGCGFRANREEVDTYRADMSSADLYDAIIFNRSMNYTDRANFLARYLLIRFPDSKEADFIRQASKSSTQPRQATSTKLRHLKKNWGWYLFLILFVPALINSVLNSDQEGKQPSKVNASPQESVPNPQIDLKKPPSFAPSKPLAADTSVDPSIQSVDRAGSYQSYTCEGQTGTDITHLVGNGQKSVIFLQFNGDEVTMQLPNTGKIELFNVDSLHIYERGHHWTKDYSEGNSGDNRFIVLATNDRKYIEIQMSGGIWQGEENDKSVRYFHCNLLKSGGHN